MSHRENLSLRAVVRAPMTCDECARPGGVYFRLWNHVTQSDQIMCPACAQALMELDDLSHN